MKSHFQSAAAIVTLSLAGAAAAQAQSIDYGSLQQLFNEPVTTSATGSPLRASEAPVDMTIITADDIKRSGATDLPTILSRVPGIDILNWGAGDSDIGVRGYDGPLTGRLLVLIDGRQVYLDHFGYTAWSNLPVELNEIRQIEVVRGPNSALFGFNAAGGVINIITFNPKYDNVNAVEAHGGTQSDFGGSVVQTAHLGDRISMRLSAGGERQDEWQDPSQYPKAWSFHTLADTVAQVTPNTELRLEGTWSRSEESDLVPSTFNYATSLLTTTSARATLTSETPYGEIQIQGYVNTLEVGALKNEVENGSIQDLIKVDKRSTLRFNLEIRNNFVNTVPIQSGHVGYTVVAPSAMWNFAATSQLSLTVAGRLDSLGLRRTGPYPAGFALDEADWDRRLNTFSANVGAVYTLTGFDTLRATYARGIQTPTLLEYGGFQYLVGPVPYGLAFGGNPDEKPAVVTNYELSYDRALTSLGAKVTAKVFLQQTDGVTDVNYDPYDPELPATATTSAYVENLNSSNSTMDGFELSASGKLGGGFHWSGDTTYTNIWDEAIDGRSLVVQRIAFAETSPKFRGNIAAGWTGARWSFDTYAHYVTTYDIYSPAGVLVPTPSYVSLAGRIAYDLDHGLTAALSGQNLATDRQIQGAATGLQAPRQVIVRLTKAW